MSGFDPRSIILAPVLTEKSLRLSGEGKYTFRVHKDATKVDIRNAVKKIFNVDVDDVSIIKVRGKQKGMRFRPFRRGRTPSWKKAVVTVKKGQRIPIYEGL